jgi:hypothetical protein
MHPRARLGLLALCLVTALTGGTAHAQPSPGRGRAHSTPAAHRALTRAQDLLHRQDARAGRRTAMATPQTAPSTAPESTPGTPPATGHEATLVLHDLAMRLGDLGPADRRAAEQILARPTDQGQDFPYDQPDRTVADCTAHFCVHWVPYNDDAQYGDHPPLTDSNGDNVPDQVELTEKVLEHVWTTEVDQMGYPTPPTDGGRGAGTLARTGEPMTPDQENLLDVYLLDLGHYGYYGYCANDTSAPHTAASWASYCALDNDFSTSQFPGRPLISLEVTAAHEFFHAVQFGMDATDDRWLMESTATWIEDEVYNGANDNRQFLPAGPLGHPSVSLDYFNPSPTDRQHAYQAQYGDWVFWKRLSEMWGRDVVRDEWTRAAKPGVYSLPALRGLLASHHTSLPTFFARFSAENRYPGKVYGEGRAYPQAPLAAAPWWFGPRHLAQQASTTLAHLSSKTFRFAPAKALTGRRTLRLHVDMPTTSRGSAATAVVHWRDGSVTRHPLRLDPTGAGHLALPFTRSRVVAVELTLSNASARLHCRTGTLLACDGSPLDNGLRSTFRVAVTR